MDIWYYLENGETMGPVTMEGLRRLVQDGTITTASLVWGPALGADWQPAAFVQDLKEPPKNDPTMPVTPVAVPPALTAPIVPSFATGPISTTAVVPEVDENADPTAVVGKVKPRIPKKDSLIRRWTTWRVLVLALAAAGLYYAARPQVHQGIDYVRDKLMALVDQHRKASEAMWHRVGAVAEPEAPPEAQPANAQGLKRPYVCPLEALDAFAQTPKVVGNFTRKDIKLQEQPQDSPEARAGLFYTANYANAANVSLDLTVMSFEKYKGDFNAGEIARAAVKDFKKDGFVLVYEEDVVYNAGHKLGRISLLRNQSRGVIIWHNGRHSMKIETSTLEDAVAFKRALPF